MATFKFGFQIQESQEEIKEAVISTDKIQQEETLKRQVVEHFSSKYFTTTGSCSYTVCDHSINYITLNDVKSTVTLPNSSNYVDDISTLISCTEKSHTDLIPGLYEGGLKIWECTYDLLERMSKWNFEGKKVLDLGCGAGLLGINALLMNAKSVHFQDFNEEVIQYYTIPNVQLNISQTELNKKCRFFSGDWDPFSEYPLDYDVILTSETVYNPQCYSKLLNVFNGLLHSQGCVLLAAKVHYFGVGGCITEFVQLIKENNVFNCITKEEIPASVPRVILELKK